MAPTGRSWEVSLRRQIFLPLGAFLLLTTGCDLARPGALSASPMPSDLAPPAVQVSCNEQISGGVVREYPTWRRESVIIGPVALWPAARQYPRTPEQVLAPISMTTEGPAFAADQLKLQLIVERGARVVVSVASPAHRHAAFLFRTEYRTAGFTIAEGARALALVGCRPHRYTEYSTGFIVDGPRCVPIEVFVGAQTAPLRESVMVGTRDC